MLGTESTETLLTNDQAATFLNLRPQTLTNWRSTRRYPLPYIRFGRCIRYRLSDLKLFVERHLTAIEPDDTDM